MEKVKELDSLLSKFSDNLQKDIDDNIKSLNKWEKQKDFDTLLVDQWCAAVIKP